MNSFSLILAKDKLSGSFSLIGTICFLSNSIIMLLIWLNAGQVIFKVLSILGFSVCMAGLFSGRLGRFNVMRIPVSQFIAFAILGFILLMTGDFFLGFCDLGLALAALFAGKPEKIIFSEEGIHLPGLFTGLQSWDKISLVILKDNVLTIDFINNKLIQTIINPSLNPAVSEDVFNEFCRKYLPAVDEGEQ